MNARDMVRLGIGEATGGEVNRGSCDGRKRRQQVNAVICCTRDRGGPKPAADVGEHGGLDAPVVSYVPAAHDILRTRLGCDVERCK